MNKRKAVVYPDGSRVEYGCDQGGFVRSVTDRSRFMKQGKCGYLCPAVGKEDLKPCKFRVQHFLQCVAHKTTSLDALFK